VDFSNLRGRIPSRRQQNHLRPHRDATDGLRGHRSEGLLLRVRRRTNRLRSGIVSIY
jgi:hypothetical protein